VEGLGACGSVLIGWEMIAAGMKEVVGSVMGGKETLHLSG
jgi:hypothetical protein